jgi:hypothetical protein
MSTVNCENCGAENPVNVNFCRQCGSKLEGGGQTAEPSRVTSATAPAIEQPAYPRSDTFASPVQARQPDVKMEKRYSVLRGIATLCKVLAIIFAVITILTGAVWFFISFSDSFLIAAGSLIGSLISAAIVYIFWRIIGESISVLLDIEENTRQTAFLLRRQQ